MMSENFMTVDRTTPYILPPSMEDWLPEDHMARFIVEVVSMLDLSPLRESYAGHGSKAYDPSVLLSLLFYGYANRTFSSRKIEAATYDSVAFRYIAAGSHPDHDTIASFRKRFLNEIDDLFIRILKIAHAMGFQKVGIVSIDGTKIKANASKHKALSYKHAVKLEKQLKAEVEHLLRLAEAADTTELSVGTDIPEELRRRSDRLMVIAEAKAEIESRANEHYESRMREYEEKIEERRRKEERTGKKASGRTPKEPKPGPEDKDQVNLTDEESRFMPVSGGGFEQAYNAQTIVDNESGLLVANRVSQSTVDKRELEPTLDELERLPEELGYPEALLADAGYFGKDNVERCESDTITPYISIGREQHNLSLEDRLKGTNPPAPETDNLVLLMEHRLKTPEGRKIYGQRKARIEPVFGIIKHVMGFRQFLLRGYNAAGGEWSLVCCAYNLKRMHRMFATA